MVDSPVATKWVAAPDNWSRGGWQPAGIVVHMAEGGGTVSWLTRPDGNSSHYVVEYSGRVVQMVLESRAAGSINPKLVRKNNDPPFTAYGEAVVYGRRTVVTAIGPDRADNPNRSVIAIEVEGFARAGPNPAQRLSLERLVNDIRRRRGVQPVLGHRDFQDYKACPGKKIAWRDYGGHAAKVGYRPKPVPIPPEPEGPMIPQFTVPEIPTRVVMEEDPARPGNSAWLYTTSDCKKDGKEVSLAPIRPLPLVGFASAEVYMLAYEGTSADPNATSLVYFARVTDVASTSPAGGSDCSAVEARLEQAETALANTTARLATVKTKVQANATDVADD